MREGVASNGCELQRRVPSSEIYRFLFVVAHLHLGRLLQPAQLLHEEIHHDGEGHHPEDAREDQHLPRRDYLLLDCTRRSAARCDGDEAKAKDFEKRA